MRAARISRTFGVFAILGVLAACGETATEQTLYGAGAGLATALLVDGDPVVGALAGGAANLAYCQANPGKCN